MKKKKLLEIINLTVKYGKRIAVDNISFSLGKGDALGLIGESGCGKTSAIQALTRLHTAAEVSGQVLFEGTDLLLKSEKQLRHVRGREIGMIFQDTASALNPVMKIGAQIAEGMIVHGIASGKLAKIKAFELLELLGVPEALLRLKQYPHELSGGMRQRVMIAIALACSPALLVADEPTSALDAVTSCQILDLMRDLRQRFQMSLIWVAHDPAAIAALCDSVAVMRKGQIVEIGTVDEVYSRPKHPYTRLLLDAGGCGAKKAEMIYAYS